MSALAAQDLFQELLAQVQRGYVRITDAQTVRYAALCRDEHHPQRRRAADQLARNAGPLVLEAATRFARRFGGILEAYDAAIYILSKQLPHGEKAGWNPKMNGVRWLSWLRYKLEAELPKEATRLVDEKTGSGAPAIIASARNRLLYGLGNDAALREWGPAVPKVQVAKHLPGGRKNILVKRGKNRVTKSFCLRGLPLSRNLCGKPPFGWNGERMICLPLAFEPWPKEVTLRPSLIPLSEDWLAAAIRANAREQLRRPGLSERTYSASRNVLNVSPAWVLRHSKAIRLDECVGIDEDDERKVDFIAGEAQQESEFEAPLHHRDATRAITALKRYGPLHGEALMRLPVRQVLPVFHRRLNQRRQRQAYRAFLERNHLDRREVEAAKAALYALSLCGLSVHSPRQEIKQQLSALSAALRTPWRFGKLAAPLRSALQETSLRLPEPEDQDRAKAFRKAFPRLHRLPLASLALWQVTLSHHGPVDQKFVQACLKAGVRMKVAEEALAKVGPIAQTVRRGTRIRVVQSAPYQRPWQLELERLARKFGREADHFGPNVAELQRALAQAEAQVEISRSQDWVECLDRVKELRARTLLFGELLNEFISITETLESAATTLNFSGVLSALARGDELLESLPHLDEDWVLDALSSPHHQLQLASLASQVEQAQEVICTSI